MPIPWQEPRFCAEFSPAPGQRHSNVLDHVMDINVPRSRQIRVELLPDGDFQSRWAHAADPGLAGESARNSQSRVFLWKNNGL